MLPDNIRFADSLNSALFYVDKADIINSQLDRYWRFNLFLDLLLIHLPQILIIMSLMVQPLLSKIDFNAAIIYLRAMLMYVTILWRLLVFPLINAFYREN